jgi:hypothetical protein
MTAKTTPGFVSPLRLRGYAALPAPRDVHLLDGDIRLDSTWAFALAAVDPQDIAVRTLLAGLQEKHNIILQQGATTPIVTLSVQPNTVKSQTHDFRDEQAYRIELAPQTISILANGLPGLFYGVQTLLQLLEGNGIERGVLPCGTITDWPRFELRALHWDTKHHQDHMDTLKRYLDQSAEFKVNAIIFELEDKFEYPSHPVIGAPGAFTSDQLQELVDYALERHIQIIPNVQSPAHMCYVLKHEEFAHLRCDGSNYQSCMDEPEVRKLLFEMYDDVCAATQGVRYFHLSTDEVYYAGICEKFRKPYNPENRSLTWVDFVNAAHAHLSKKGRQVIVWGEYPLLPEHTHLLPPDLLNGIGLRDPKRTAAENEHGIRQFAYNPIQGAELTFPNYFAFTDSDGNRNPGHLADSYTATCEPKVASGNPIGALCTAWSDAGLHNETFWLGWASMAQTSWTQDAADALEMTSVFMEVYYGRDVAGMVDIYQSLQDQARFMEYALEKLPSTVRGPSYGHPYWKGKMERTDRTMIHPTPPRMPNDTAIALLPVFSDRYASVLAKVPAQLAANDRLLAGLHENLTRARRNRYNIEVFISIAHYVRHFLQLLQAIAAAEQQMHRASIAGKGADAKNALNHMLNARKTLRMSNDDLYVMFEKLKAVWEKSRDEKGQSVDGRDFVHVMDDVKDHFADRRVGLDYLIAPQESLELDQWLEQLDDVIKRYGEATGLAIVQQDKVPVDEG